jgi:hypothetical protein
MSTKFISAICVLCLACPVFIANGQDAINFQSEKKDAEKSSWEAPFSRGSNHENNHFEGNFKETNSGMPTEMSPGYHTASDFGRPKDEEGVDRTKVQPRHLEEKKGEPSGEQEEKTKPPEKTALLYKDAYLLEKIKAGEIVVTRLNDGKLQITLIEDSCINSIVGRSKDWRINGPWLVFCIFAIFFLCCALYLFYFKADKNILAFKVTVLIVLSVSSLILIVGGYAKEQIVPVIGFFSTVAGFLLGSREPVADKKDNPA